MIDEPDILKRFVPLLGIYQQVSFTELITEPHAKNFHFIPSYQLVLDRFQQHLDGDRITGSDACKNQDGFLYH